MNTCEEKISIALVRMLGQDRFESPTAPHNVGLLYLAESAIREGAKVTIFDPFDFEEYSNCSNPLLHSNFHLIGFTTHILNIEETIIMSKLIKDYRPNTVIILGGHHASASANEILNDNDFIDAVCVGEGENVIKQLITEILDDKSSEIRKKGIYKSLFFNDLNTLSFPKREKHSKIARIISSRGCPYSCTFCTTPGIRLLTDEPVYRERSYLDVVNEIEYLYKNGARRVIFNDDMFAVRTSNSHQRAVSIAEEIINRGISISYKIQLRADTFTWKDIDVLKLLRKSGLREVFLGIESGSDAALLNFNKRATFEDNLNAINLYDSIGIKVNAGNILGAPESTVEEVCNSIYGFHKMKIAYLFFRRVTTRAVVLPGTELEKELESKNLLELKPRYLLRNYKFEVFRVGRIIEMLEENMPRFISEVGEQVFPLKNKAVVYHFERKSRDKFEDNELSLILNDWNDKSAIFLLRWFKDLPNSSLNKIDFENEFNDYINEVKVIRERLFEYVKTFPYDDFFGDSF